MTKLAFILIGVLGILATTYAQEETTPINNEMVKRSKAFSLILDAPDTGGVFSSLLMIPTDTAGLIAFEDSLKVWSKEFPSVGIFLKKYSDLVNEAAFDLGMVGYDLQLSTQVGYNIVRIGETIQFFRFSNERPTDSYRRMRTQMMLAGSLLEYMKSWHTDFRYHLHPNKNKCWDIWRKLQKSVDWHNRKYDLAVQEVDHLQARCLTDLTLEVANREQYHRIAAALDQLTFPRASVY